MLSLDKGLQTNLEKGQPLLFMFYFLGVGVLAFGVDRTNFGLNYGIYFLLFCLWISIIKCNSNSNILFVAGLFSRLLFLWSIPQWSDDFNRFIWDGKLLVEGINPYLFTPSQLAQHSWAMEVEYKSTFYALNSPNYYTVYPTVVMFLNWLCVFFGKSVAFSLFLMKLLFVFGDVAIYFILKNLLKIEVKKLAWYWMCPLIVIEFSGNLHHELWLILFVILALYFLKQQKAIWLAMCLSLAIFTKLTPLLFVPFFFVYVSKKWVFSLCMIFFCAILVFPMLYNHGFTFFIKSVHLYFSTFEFNSSFYVLFKPLFWFEESLTLVYKGLVMVVMAFFFWFWKKNRMPLIIGLIGIQWIYLLSAQSIHPWYILPLLPFYIFLEFPLYYLAWLLLIPLSYITYASIPYQQQIWVNGLEYLSVGLLFWYEHYKQKKSILHG